MGRNIITRFAPSPTGYLHLGHAASAAQAFGFAAQRGGECLLRIEDIDTVRCRPEYEAAIYEDLSWLGFSWPQPARRQSDHFADYEAALLALRGMGVLYRCFKTRKEVLEDMLRAPHGPGQIYTGPARPLSKHEEGALIDSGKPFAWRLSLRACRDKLGAAFEDLQFTANGQTVTAKPALLGDVILARKDIGTSYHLACCHDDALQGVTDIVRGEDLRDAAHIHRLLQELMGWPVPDYHFHPLLTGPDGKRLAKRDKAQTLRSLRTDGLTPEMVLSQSALPR